MVLGDFNSVRRSIEKVGGCRVNMAWLERFNSSIINAGLSDLKTEGANMTWTNRQRGNGRILERIDRTLVNGTWLMHYPSSWADCLTTRTSDHSPIAIRWEQVINWGPKPFKHFNYWFRKAGYREIVEEVWSSPDVGRPQLAVASKLKTAKHLLKIWDRSSTNSVMDAVLEKRKIADAIQRKIQDDPLNETLATQDIRATNELESALWAEESFYR